MALPYFEIIAAAARRHLATSCRRKVSQRQISSFSQNTALVALGIRSAYLVDSLDASCEEIQAVIDALCKDGLPLRILEVTTVSSSGIFIINPPLLSEVLESSNFWTTMIELGYDGRSCGLMEPPLPDVLVRDLQDILDQSRKSEEAISLAAVPLSSAIALAGILLEYPVSYMPLPPPEVPGDKMGYLGGIELLVVTCYIRQRQGLPNKVDIIKFSCPTGLLRSGLGKQDNRSPSLPYSPGDLALALENRWAGRLKKQCLDEKFLVETDITKCTFDRLAL